MKLTFIGADHEVTGSCHFLEIGDKKLLVDCGMEQGKDLFVNREMPSNPGDIDYILITHAHIDHTGKLPLMVKQGFKGQIFATQATCELCDIMLRDSAHIQEFEAQWRNRKAKRSGKPKYEPMYDMTDVQSVLSMLVPVEYDRLIEIDENITVRFGDVGHLLGSAYIEIFARENGVTKTIVFSGDIGNVNKPIIRNPKAPERADIVIMESTYGNRLHEENPDYIGTMSRVFRETFKRGGNVVIPSFAVGRTQELLYFIRLIKNQNLVPEFSNFEVYVDSPLAVEATQVFRQNEADCFDDETRELLRQGINPLQFRGLKVSVTSNDSIAINEDPKSKVIIAASGMCDAGRVRHHLKHNLWRPESTVLFVGYQSEGTLGNLLLSGAKTVKLFGEEIEVNAAIEQMPGTSSHADKLGLVKWLRSIDKPEKVYLVHGDPETCDSFAACLRDEMGYNAYAPYSGTVVDLITGKILEAPKPEPIVRKNEDAARKSGGTTVYDRLLAAGNRLMAVIKRNQGAANKDLARFADQISALCDKWDIR